MSAPRPGISRWLVEVSPMSYEDVGAHTLEVQGGCLVFRDETYKVAVAYPATAWLSVAAE